MGPLPITNGAAPGETRAPLGKYHLLIWERETATLRALHCSYGVGNGVSYTKATAFLEHCREFTLRGLVAEQAIKIFMDAVHVLAEDRT